MSYYCTLIEQKFFMSKENIEKASRDIYNPEYQNIFINCCVPKIIDSYKSHTLTIDDVLYTLCNISVDYDSDDSWYYAYYSEKWNDSYNMLLNIIAPYMEPGCYLTFSGETGNFWQIKFTPNGYQEVNLKLCENDVCWDSLSISEQTTVIENFKYMPIDIITNSIFVRTDGDIYIKAPNNEIEGDIDKTCSLSA